MVQQVKREYKLLWSLDVLAAVLRYRLLDFIKESAYYALQMDESTDIANHATLLVYVRYVWEGDLEEQFLCSRDLPTTTTAEDIFSTVDLYLGSLGLSWENCVGITTDGAASMTGKHSGVVKRILERASNATWNHCFLHGEALASKNMAPVLDEMLKEVVKVVKHIKRSAKTSPCFKNLCKDLGSEHVQLLYHSEIRWLSRGKVLARFYELKTEIAVFLSENNSPYADLFNDEIWLARVAYLADVFEHLNTLNVSMRGRGHNIFEQSDKVAAFKKKIELWTKHVNKDRLDMFPNTCNETQQLDIAGKIVLKKTITEHLSKLQVRFNDYFPEKHEDDPWIRDPFGIDMESVTLPSNEENQLVELSCAKTLKKKFSEVSLSQFWCREALSEYPSLATRAIKTIQPFSTTYLCESGFSSLVQLKSKKRNRLNIERDLRVALSTITPDFETLIRRLKLKSTGQQLSRIDFAYPCTWCFSPPEWVCDEEYLGFPATMWGLGVLLFHLICGHLPFNNEDEIVYRKMDFAPGLSEAIWMSTVVLRLVKKHVQEMLKAMDLHPGLLLSFVSSNPEAVACTKELDLLYTEKCTASMCSSIKTH
ncbi:protein FAM200A-like [Hemibagrus wyckioides]|uniref:protein FAM200A-like n=1 Tax=Hemibagrus wyckioides TaxID=337641 RepID=UPI00266CC2F2|nr:protein FAM200A-like [Hemibagrus wyckioides]